MSIYPALIIFIVFVLVAILVKINFADTTISTPVKIITSLLILAILGFGIWYFVKMDGS